jgi:hypothetical protein
MKSNSCEMPFDENDITQYNPLHNVLGINPKKRVREYTDRVSYNKFEFIDTEGNKKTCFKKFITLVDYVKYLIGKYKPEEMNTLPSIENFNNKDNQFQEYINSQHNYAYVDGFFYFLTSKLLNEGFVHGLDFYDNYVCLTKNCEINIADDFEYLSDSDFFNEHIHKLFQFKDETFGNMFKKNVPISLSDETIEIKMDSLDDLDDETKVDDANKVDANKVDEQSINPIVLSVETLEDAESSESETCESETCESDTSESDTSEELKEIINETNDSGSEDSDHSTVDLSDSDNDSDNDSKESNNTEEWETDDETNGESSEEDEIENLTLIVNKIPTQVVAIECCEVTFDSILEKNEIRIEELESAIFQIIAMLYLYQKAFNFTHNDLHTNNIMCISTKEEFLQYKIMGKYYKIPTYGRIYKIIDFGRAIYTVNGIVLCSDSFSENGTAHTQYNCEPFYNPKKPLIEPNYSFDLCRLSCSMVDFIVEDMRQLNNYRKVPVYDLIISWLYDDNGVNILYKKNGEERYPDFKLYKMIARLVHNHLPENQFSHECFKQYETGTLETCMDLDAIKNQVHL